MTWLREGKPITLGGRYEEVKQGLKRILKIRDVVKKDEGEYAVSIQGKVCKAKMYVAPDVVIKQPLEGGKFLEREILTLECKTKNPKNYPVQWFRNGEELKPSDDRLTIKSNKGNETLILKNIKTDDEGEYVCQIGPRRKTKCQVKVDEGRLNLHLIFILDLAKHEFMFQLKELQK